MSHVSLSRCSRQAVFYICGKLIRVEMSSHIGAAILRLNRLVTLLPLRHRS
jgi:hypothetical protein